MEGNETETGAQTGAGTGNSNSATTGQGTPPATGGTFTQADVDRIVRERLAEQARKHEEKAAKDREAAEAEREKARLAEEGKYKEIADRAEAARQKAERERDDALAASRERAIKSEIRSVATELRFADPGDAFRFLDLSKVEMNADGEPVNVRQLLEDLVNPQKGNKAYLLKHEGTGPRIPPTPPGSGQADPAEIEQINRSQQLKTGRYHSIM